MEELHNIFGWAVVIINGFGGVLGLVSVWRRWPYQWAGQVISLGHAAVVLVGLFGLILVSQVDEPSDPLHARVYGPVMLIAIIYGYTTRADDARRNMITFSIISLLIAGMGLRALQTGV